MRPHVEMPGDVHDDVDRSGDLVRAGRKSIDGVDVAHVERLVVRHRAAGFGDQAHGLGEGVRRDVGEHQP